jgi:hypothetical protein
MRNSSHADIGGSLDLTFPLSGLSGGVRIGYALND